MNDDEFDLLLGHLSDLTPEQRKMVSAQLALVRNDQERDRVTPQVAESEDHRMLVWKCSRSVVESMGLGMVTMSPVDAARYGVPAQVVDRYSQVSQRVVDYVDHHVKPTSYAERWRALYKVIKACCVDRPFPLKKTVTIAYLTDRLDDFEAAVSSQYPHYAASGQLRFALKI